MEIINDSDGAHVRVDVGQELQQLTVPLEVTLSARVGDDRQINTRNKRWGTLHSTLSIPTGDILAHTFRHQIGVDPTTIDQAEGKIHTYVWQDTPEAIQARFNPESVTVQPLNYAEEKVEKIVGQRIRRGVIAGYVGGVVSTASVLLGHDNLTLSAHLTALGLSVSAISFLLGGKSNVDQSAAVRTLEIAKERHTLLKLVHSAASSMVAKSAEKRPVATDSAD